MKPLTHLLALLTLLTVPTAGVVGCLLAAAYLGQGPSGRDGDRPQVLWHTQERGLLQHDESVGAATLSVGGRRQADGLGTHAHSRIRIAWAGRADTFRGGCGIDDSSRGRGSAVFKVVSKRRLLWQSPVLRPGQGPLPFEVPVSGLSGLELIVEDAGDGIEGDFADWVGLRLRRPVTPP